MFTLTSGRHEKNDHAYDEAHHHEAFAADRCHHQTFSIRQASVVGLRWYLQQVTHERVEIHTL